MTQDATTPITDAQIKAHIASLDDTARTVEHVLFNPVTREIVSLAEQHDPTGLIAKAAAEVAALNTEVLAFANGEPSLIVPHDQHEIVPIGAGPQTLDAARALPHANPDETLYAIEHTLIRAFMDAEDAVKHVYLNVLGHFVKA